MWFLLLCLWMKSLTMSIQWKAILVVLFIMLYKVVIYIILTMVIESQGLNSQIEATEGTIQQCSIFQNEIWQFCPVFQLVKARSNKIGALICHFAGPSRLILKDTVYF